MNPENQGLIIPPERHVGVGKLSHKSVTSIRHTLYPDLSPDKSGKKFAPKAPARRPAAPTSAQASTRPSVDRQLQSQTPQPQVALQPTAASGAPPTPSLIPAPSDHVPTEAAKSAHTTEIASIPLPLSQGTPKEQTQNPVSEIHVRHTPTASSQAPKASFATASYDGDSNAPRDKTKNSQGPNLICSEFISAPASSLGADNRGADAVVTARSATSDTTGQKDAQQSTEARAPKRRRIESPQRSHVAQLAVAGTDFRVTPTSTEANEVITNKSSSLNDDATSQIIKGTRPRQRAPKKGIRRTVETSANSGISTAQSSSKVTKQSRKRVNKRGATVSEVTPSDQITSPIAAGPSAAVSQVTPKQQRRKNVGGRAKQSIEDAASAVINDAAGVSSRKREKRKTKRKRDVTPEDAEKQKILSSQTKMSDLCKDPRIGRKSNREKQIDEFEKAELSRKKQRQLQEFMDQAEPESGSGSVEPAESRLEQLARRKEQEESTAHNVPNVTIVNGVIQVDEDSLHIDRHRAAEAERNTEQLETVEENDMFRKINSATFLKRDKSGGWNALLTERFYQGLRMFGTDFGMISKMFPGRTRHKIKLKFVNEEKWNHDKIKATLLGEQVPVDIKEIEEIAGVEFEDPEELEKDLEEDRKKLEEEILVEKEALDALRQEREAEIASERAAADEESSAKENRKGKRQKKKHGKRKGRDDASRRGEID